MDFNSAYQKKFNPKIYSGENVEVTVVYFCYGHVSLKRERILLNRHFFATTETIFMSVKKNKGRGNTGIWKKLQAYQMFKRK